MLGPVRVDDDFTDEYPDGYPRATEAYATLARTGTALLLELDRCILATFDLPHSSITALAVVDGSDVPLTPSQISERMLVPSATMTATLDQLERRGWIERLPNPDDRRSVLVAITPSGRETADLLLPGIRRIERTVMSGLTERELTQLLRLLAKVLAGAADVAAAPPIALEGRRVRLERHSTD
jgi:DNA-binding MarR family transcriptional regulator